LPLCSVTEAPRHEGVWGRGSKSAIDGAQWSDSRCFIPGERFLSSYWTSERCEVEEHVLALQGVEARSSSPQTIATMTELHRIDDDHLRSLTRQSGRTAAVPTNPSVDQCRHPFGTSVGNPSRRKAPGLLTASTTLHSSASLGAKHPVQNSTRRFELSLNEKVKWRPSQFCCSHLWINMAGNNSNPRS
jgi:hypothetical protein